MMTPTFLRPKIAQKLGAALCSALLLSACGQSAEEAGPGGVSAGEAEALDDAAEIIEQRRLPVEALPENTAGNGAPLPPERAPEPEDAQERDQAGAPSE